MFAQVQNPCELLYTKQSWQLAATQVQRIIKGQLLVIKMRRSVIIALVTTSSSKAFVLHLQRSVLPCKAPSPGTSHSLSEPWISSNQPRLQNGQPRVSSMVRYNFFKDLLGDAFENDASLSKVDKRDGMLDEGIEGADGDRAARTTRLTATQQQWRQKVLSTGVVQSTDMERTRFKLDFYLTGIPDKDPSNDLFGSKTNISSRDRVVGLTLPTKPSVAGVILSFESNGLCRVLKDESGFCVVGSDQTGEWKLSDDGRQIRFRIPVTGFTRTIETKGTIQKVYWSSQEETSSRTSTVYTIPAGWLYGESELIKPAGKKTVQWTGDGVLKVEIQTGILGASLRMIPCGRFSSKSLLEEDVEDSLATKHEETANSRALEN